MGRKVKRKKCEERSYEGKERGKDVRCVPPPRATSSTLAAFFFLAFFLAARRWFFVRPLRSAVDPPSARPPCGRAATAGAAGALVRGALGHVAGTAPGTGTSHTRSRSGSVSITFSGLKSVWMMDSLLHTHGRQPASRSAPTKQPSQTPKQPTQTTKQPS
eukprot:193439-Chlamydomonas_euryale.AAC.1